MAKPNQNSSSCVLFVPDDKENVYKTRDLGVDFVHSRCLATYGSWLLMVKSPRNRYILNLLTGERIDLPDTKRRVSVRASLWIDNKTKDYLVVLIKKGSSVFIKKGDNMWRGFSRLEWHKEILYNHKNQKLYTYHNNPVNVWDFSGDRPWEDGIFKFNHYDFPGMENLSLYSKTRIAVTISGDVLMVACCRVKHYKTWRFCIYKANHVNRIWVKIDSLGDEALILDMCVTVVAKDIPGIKRNSIYFSGVYNFTPGRDDPKDIFVFDLTTQKIEPLPQCVFSSIHFSDPRWFFPEF